MQNDEDENPGNTLTPDSQVFYFNCFHFCVPNVISFCVNCNFFVRIYFACNFSLPFDLACDFLVMNSFVLVIVTRSFVEQC